MSCNTQVLQASIAWGRVAETKGTPINQLWQLWAAAHAGISARQACAEELARHCDACQPHRTSASAKDLSFGFRSRAHSGRCFCVGPSSIGRVGAPTGALSTAGDCCSCGADITSRPAPRIYYLDACAPQSTQSYAHGSGGLFAPSARHRARLLQRAVLPQMGGISRSWPGSGLHY